MEAIRRARYAGTWYDDDPAALRSMIAETLAEARRVQVAREAHVAREARARGESSSSEPVKGRCRPVAAILPHAGLHYAGRGIAGLFVSLLENPPDRIVIIAPSHYRPIPADVLVTSRAAKAETPLGHVPLFSGSLSLPDSELVVDDEAVAIEHALEMFLPYIAYLGGSPAVMPEAALFLLSSVSSAQSVHHLAERFIGWLGAETLTSGECCLIASSDFTHYGARFGYRPYGPAVGKAWEPVTEQVRALDLRLAECFARGEYEEALTLREASTPPPTICGFAPALIVSAVTSALGLSGTVEDRYTSFDITGRDDDSFVTYCRVQWEV